MTISPDKLETFRKRQHTADDEITKSEAQVSFDNQEREKREKIAALVAKSRNVAGALAKYAGGHVYLGGDALVRDYHSEWLNFAPFQGDPNTVTQLGVERVERVLRDRNNIEQGTSFDAINIKVRLFDTQRRVHSPVTEGAIRFSPDGVSMSGEVGERITVEPDSETWSEIEKIIDILPALETTGVSSLV